MRLLLVVLVVCGSCAVPRQVQPPSAKEARSEVRPAVAEVAPPVALMVPEDDDWQQVTGKAQRGPFIGPEMVWFSSVKRGRIGVVMQSDTIESVSDTVMRLHRQYAANGAEVDKIDVMLAAEGQDVSPGIHFAFAFPYTRTINGLVTRGKVYVSLARGNVPKTIIVAETALQSDAPAEADASAERFVFGITVGKQRGGQ